MQTLLLLALTFCWDSHPDATSFRLYKDGALNQEVTATRATVADLQHSGTYKFHITALRDGLESDPSEPVTFHAPRMKMEAPGRFKFTRPLHKSNQRFVVESTTDFQTWQTEEDLTETVLSVTEEIETVEVEVDGADPHRFYRIKIVFERVGCAAE